MSNEHISVHKKREGKPFIIYGLICPITLEVKYVGQSTDFNQRFLQHTGVKGGLPEVREWIKSLGGYLRPHRVIFERGINRIVRLKYTCVRKPGSGRSPNGYKDVWLSSCLETKWMKRFQRTILNRRATQVPRV